MPEPDLSQMSPEQLRQMQKQQCIFCHIVDKKVQARVVYDDEKVIALLDINPANPGHVLLLPKEHYTVMPQMPDELSGYLGVVAKQISAAMVNALGCEGTSIIVANGPAAGQRASHNILHIIPRKEGDKLGLGLEVHDLKPEQIADMQNQLSPLFAKAFGTPAVIPEKRHEARQQASEKTEAKEAKQEAGKTNQENAKHRQKQQQKEEEQKETDGKDVDLDTLAGLLLGGRK
jgi:histidine triad (HIT) family protein